MVKVVRRPLMVANGYDIMGNYRGEQEDTLNLAEVFKKIEKEFGKKKRNDLGEVHIEGLGWVK